MKRVRVGSRDSRLAIVQAQKVMEAIQRFDPCIQIELITMKTTGDRILDRTLDQIGGKGLFVKELDEALLRGDVDITVHSYKDLPVQIHPDLPVVALSEREDARDVLIFPEGIAEGERPVGCSSKRRMLQLKELGFDAIAPLRGNVLTRLKKLDDGEYRAIVLAAAGIRRLGLADRISRFFSVSEIIPAAGQGILAVQARKGEDTGYLKYFHSAVSAIVSQAERAFITALNSGCSSPVAAYAYLEGDTLVLSGLYADEEKMVPVRGVHSGPLADAEKIGIELAHRLAKEAGRTI